MISREVIHVHEIMQEFLFWNHLWVQCNAVYREIIAEFMKDEFIYDFITGVQSSAGAAGLPVARFFEKGF